MTAPLLDVRALDVVLGHGRAASPIVSDVGFTVPRGTTLGLVGESGSGKSTIAKTIVGIHRARNGEILFGGVDLATASRRERAAARRRIQLIPQNPYSSLDPRLTIGQSLAEAIDPVHARARLHRERIGTALSTVSLDADVATRYPHEFSGGQRQRIAIARALVVEPQLVIADEITSALDMSTQAEILALLARLRIDLSLTMLFISHNLAVVSEVCDDVIVLLQGEIVESGPVRSVFASPQRDYTRALLSAVPGTPGFAT
jgi:ABC-type glutathione transport system ATPase component